MTGGLALHVPTHPVRIVTAASLFDGHDASINIMRRILQASGAEVIHLGHNRSVKDVVDTALQRLYEAQHLAGRLPQRVLGCLSVCFALPQRVLFRAHVIFA